MTNKDKFIFHLRELGWEYPTIHKVADSLFEKDILTKEYQDLKDIVTAVNQTFKKE